MPVIFPKHSNLYMISSQNLTLVATSSIIASILCGIVIFSSRITSLQFKPDNIMNHEGHEGHKGPSPDLLERENKFFYYFDVKTAPSR